MRRLLPQTALAVCAIAYGACGSSSSPNGSPTATADGGATGDAAHPLTSTRLTAPDRTEVSDAQGWLATFTDGARSVRVRGAARKLTEPTASPVSTSTWVRLLPAPFAGNVDEAWLATALADASPDVIGIGMQYIAGAPVLLDDKGLQIAGHAAYGPLESTSGFVKTADFNDYLGVPWTYSDGPSVKPEPAQLHALDCSGFMRMVWGYRSGVPLALTLTSPLTVPRRAAQIFAMAPGIVLLKDDGTRPADLSRLLIGDLVFFNARPADGTGIDHVGMFLGVDDAKHLRFISSRKTPDGPTMGDTGGPSILDGDALYARSLRGARRL